MLPNGDEWEGWVTPVGTACREQGVLPGALPTGPHLPASRFRRDRTAPSLAS